MKYSYEFKVQCVEAYKGFGTISVPEGVNPNHFKKKVRIWVRLYELHGFEALRHKVQNRQWNAEQKMEIVAQVLAGSSVASTAIQHGISDGQLYQWVRRYKSAGYNGLVDKPKGRKTLMKKTTRHLKPLTLSEKEELILLREKTKALEAEIAAIKKERALRLKRWERALKAKKQKSSKSLKTKDIN